MIARRLRYDIVMEICRGACRVNADPAGSPAVGISLARSSVIAYGRRIFGRRTIAQTYARQRLYHRRIRPEITCDNQTSAVAHRVVKRCIADMTPVAAVDFGFDCQDVAFALNRNDVLLDAVETGFEPPARPSSHRFR